jgi:hypothetical protein
MKSRKNTLTPAEYRDLQHSFAERIMHDPKMSHAFLKVGVAYLLHINGQSGAAWPGTKTIVELTGLSERTVNRARKYYSLKGHMAADRRPGKSTIFYPQRRNPEADPRQQAPLCSAAGAGTPDEQVMQRINALFHEGKAGKPHLLPQAEELLRQFREFKQQQEN